MEQMIKLTGFYRRATIEVYAGSGTTSSCYHYVYYTAVDEILSTEYPGSTTRSGLAERQDGLRDQLAPGCHAGRETESGRDLQHPATSN